jgi:hypothetical protein
MKQRIFLGVFLALWSALSCAGVIKTIQAGATDQTVVIRIIDSTDGTPETGVVFNTSGIDLEYWRHGANSVVDITEATQTVNGAHTDGGFVHLGNGYYRLDLPDAAVAAGATAVEVMGTVTGMIVIGGTVQLSPPVNVVQFGGTDGTFTSGRPNVNASHLGGTSQTGRDIGASVLISSGTGTGQLSVTSGVIASNVTQFGGSAGTFASGRPEVNASHWGGTAVASATVNANMTQISGDSGAADALESAFDGTAGAVSPLGIARQGTAQSATSTTLVLDSSASFADDVPIGMTLLACGSTQGYCQARAVTDYVSSTDTATVDTWTVTPSGTITYYLFGTAPFEIEAGSGSLTAEDVWTYNDRQLTALDEDSTTIDINATPVGAAASVTGNVGGNVSGTVNGLTSTAQGHVRTAVGLSTANLDTQLGDLPTNAELASALESLAAAGVYSLGYINADGDQCTMVISETDPKLDVTCTEAE